MTMTTGDLIKRYREHAGMSQRALEEKIDLSQSSIVRIEKGDRQVKSYELSAIAAALGCPESSLMESHPRRDRVQYAARTNGDNTPDMTQVKEHLFFLLEMDTYLTRALKTLPPA
ncbi:helix-turn-helix domain-containing protein [Specibacter cremeus]|uniref:helix-turn-helix domain-containing protein n=1 Tax=Specibacter cremeus TaxID=1629051 RepID=UPI000F7803AF|nr:helix-turn-helix transcriptional regulator [Specibacter cremeus]